MGRLSKRERKLQSDAYYSSYAERGIDEKTVIRIEWDKGYMEVPYMYIERQPPHMRNKRNWERWVRKIIRIAAKNGGWNLIQR